MVTTYHPKAMPVILTTPDEIDSRRHVQAALCPQSAIGA
jgi:hypothetical protein